MEIKAELKKTTYAIDVRHDKKWLHIECDGITSHRITIDAVDDKSKIYYGSMKNFLESGDVSNPVKVIGYYIKTAFDVSEEMAKETAGKIVTDMIHEIREKAEEEVRKEEEYAKYIRQKAACQIANEEAARIEKKESREEARAEKKAARAETREVRKAVRAIRKEMRKEKKKEKKK